IGGAIFVGSQAWEWATFIKGDYGAVQTKGGNILQFVNVDGQRVKLSDFVVGGTHDRVEHERNNGLWYVEEGSLPSYTLGEVVASFEANPDLLVRTQQINEHGEKTVLSRNESLKQLKTNGRQVVEGANLHVNEYGATLFADFFFFITGFH